MLKAGLSLYEFYPKHKTERNRERWSRDLSLCPSGSTDKKGIGNGDLGLIIVFTALIFGADYIYSLIVEKITHRNISRLIRRW